VGLVVERLLISPLYKRIPLYSLLLTFGLALIFEEVFRLIWGPASVPFSPPAYLQGTTQLGDVYLPTYRFIIMAALGSSWCSAAVSSTGRARVCACAARCKMPR
jgi:branched-chain amino acid transport system permease protein